MRPPIPEADKVHGHSLHPAFQLSKMEGKLLGMAASTKDKKTEEVTDSCAFAMKNFS